MNIQRFVPFLKKRNNRPRTPILFKLYEKLPKLSFALSIFVTLTGILALVLFPTMLLALPYALYTSVMSAHDLKDWINPAIFLTLILLAAGFCWAIYQLKFSLPTGLEVTKEKFPQLSKLITELQEEFGNPKIERILLRDAYDIRVIKTPRSGMPFLNTRTLIIGLPVLLTMPPVYFRALLARRIGQLSTKHTPVTTRLYFLNDTWLQLKDACKHSRNGFAKALGYFFQLYSPLYQHTLMPLLQNEELEADRYGMDLVNNQDMVECVVYEEVVIQFLNTKFWPKIYHMAKRSKTPQYLPYAQMTKVIKTGISNTEISEVLQRALKIDFNAKSMNPSLTNRLNHLGHSKPLPPKRLTQTAADYYLGNASEQVIQLFDKHWLKKLATQK